MTSETDIMTFIYGLCDVTGMMQHKKCHVTFSERHASHDVSQQDMMSSNGCP
jgi:hypothetical protein